MKGKLIPTAVIKLLWEKFTMKVKIQSPGAITGWSHCVVFLCSQLSFYTLFAMVCYMATREEGHGSMS